jgi:hypothetical protein
LRDTTEWRGGVKAREVEGRRVRRKRGRRRMEGGEKEKRMLCVRVCECMCECMCVCMWVCAEQDEKTKQYHDIR